MKSYSPGALRLATIALRKSAHGNCVHTTVTAVRGVVCVRKTYDVAAMNVCIIPYII